MKKLQKTVVAFMILILLVCLLGNTLIVNATTTKEQIQQTQQEKNELENELNKTQENLEGLKGEHKTLKGELSNLNTQLTVVSDNLSTLEQQIRDKEVSIEETQICLAKAMELEEWQYDCMVIRVRDMYERKDTNYLNAILNAGNFSEMLNAADIFEQIAKYDQKKLQEFKDNRAIIQAQEALLQQEKAELDALKVVAKAEKDKVTTLINQTSSTVEKYATEIADAEAKALAYEAEIKKKEEDLVYLRKKLAEELALSKAAADGVWRDISEVEFDEGDRYLLANLIYCEAGGEPYEGQVAVGSVVINRLLSNKFPDTLVGVIYQKRQFSPVGSGRLELALATDKATDSCYRAADEAMAGVTNVGNCVFFRTPIEGLSGINIGGHVFY